MSLFRSHRPRQLSTRLAVPEFITMFQFLLPDFRFRSLVDIELSFLQQHGLECLMLDMDCTLKDQYAEEFSDEVLQWVEQMKSADVRMAVVSNGRTPRIAPFAKQLGLACVADAAKPLPRGIRRGMKELGMNPESVGIVGDQIFSDVIAGKLAGIRTILVQSRCTREPWITRVKRPIERLIVRW